MLTIIIELQDEMSHFGYRLSHCCDREITIVQKVNNIADLKVAKMLTGCDPCGVENKLRLSIQFRFDFSNTFA